MNKLAAIYRIKNLDNGKVYIGETEDISRRWVEHLKELVNGTHGNYKLQNDFNTYGINSFEFLILESIIFDSQDDDTSNTKLKLTLLCREHAYIKHYDSVNNGYNLEYSLKKIYENNLDIFNRSKQADTGMQYAIKNFLKENKDLLNIETAMTNRMIKTSSALKREEKATKKKIKNSNTKEKPVDKLSDTYFRSLGCVSLTSIYNELKTEGYFSEEEYDIVFKTILKDEGLVEQGNRFWMATNYSIEHEYILLGRESHYSDGNVSTKLWVTPSGQEIIKDIIKEKRKKGNNT